MNINEFSTKIDFLNAKEIDKVKYILFYVSRYQEKAELSLDEVNFSFLELGLPKPNISRLRKNISNSKIIVKGSKKDTYKLHVAEYRSIELRIRQKDHITIVACDSVLPEELYNNTRKYILNLAKQINASYEFNIYDGCAVLMRRLLEILLIHTYENYSLESSIKDKNGDFAMLSKIVKHANNNTILALSRNTKECLEDFRSLGNFAAHKIYYNTTRNDIKKTIINFRATIEELLYKSNIKK